MNLKISYTHKELVDNAKNQQQQETDSVLKETLTFYKVNPIDTGPVKIIAHGVDNCSRVIDGLLRILKQGNKMLQKFV